MSAVEAGAWPEEIEIGTYADSAVTLPGKGDSGEGCGEWFPREFCDACGEVQFGRSRCEQRACPSCWRAWSRRRAEGATRRLGAARYAADDGLDRRAVHAVLSPPEGSIRTLVDVRDGFRDAYRLAERKGVRGGVAIFHGFRVTDEGKSLYEVAKDRGEWDPDEDGRLWAFVREHERRWRSLTYWSPHYHILGLSRDFDADDPDEQEGWVARRIRTLAPFRLTDEEGYSDMVGVTMYLLSHATFESGTSRDCVRWFGDLATTQFSPEEALSEGSLSVVERMTEEVVEAGPPTDGESDERQACDRCGSRSLSPIWEAGGALVDPRWCDEIGREQERRLTAAFEWAIGDRPPPPGLRHPESEDEAREALAAIL